MKENNKYNKRYDWTKIQLYYNEGNSYNDIIKYFGCTKSTISKAAKCGKLKVRSIALATKLYLEKNPPRKHSAETKKKISEIRKAFLKENPDKVPYRLNHSSKESYPEKLFRLALEKSNINEIWVQEYRNSVYSYDFAFLELKIDVEIDGQTHESEKVKKIDFERDNFSIENGWTVLRFSAEQIKKDIDSCIQQLLNEIHIKNMLT